MMMRLCFGTFAQVLRLCKLENVTGSQLVGTMTRTVDPECQYINSANATTVSRLFSCNGNLSNGRIKGGIGAVQKPGNSLSNVIQAAQKADKVEVAQKFGECVIGLLDEDKKQTAVIALLDIIKNDTVIDNDKKMNFEKYMGTTKKALLSQSKPDLADFLSGIFLYTVIAVKNTVGKECVKELTWEYIIGINKTEVLIDAVDAIISKSEPTNLKDSDIDKPTPQVANIATRSSVHEQNLDRASLSKSLLDLFEDAIDTYNIASFVDADFTAMPLYFNDVVAVDVFIEDLRDSLRSFRRNQDSTYKFVISFVSILEEYSTYMSMRMITDDGKTIHWLPRINWSEVHEDTLNYRRQLDKLYGLISGGGTLSVFGYSMPEKDNEAESNKSENHAGKSSATNSQIVNNLTDVQQKGNTQIGNNNFMIGNIGSLTINND